MRLTLFLRDLFDSGRVMLEGDPAEIDPEDRAEAALELAERARLVSADFPAAAPGFDEAAALWAANQFYAAAHYVMFRESDADAMRKALSTPSPAGNAPELHFSIDLVFSFLRDLDRLSASLAPHDPLRESLRIWANQWPLSSVGMKGVVPERTAELLAHAGLRQAYVDRIVQLRDASRLADPLVRDLVQAALGAERMKSNVWCSEPAVAAASPTNLERTAT